MNSTITASKNIHLGLITDMSDFDNHFVSNGTVTASIGSSNSGLPSDAIIVTHCWDNNQWAKQVAYAIDNELVYVRRKVRGTWGTWYKISTTNI